jgi:hypothetical protein
VINELKAKITENTTLKKQNEVLLTKYNNLIDNIKLFQINVEKISA